MAESLSNKQLALIFLFVILAGFLFGSAALLYPFGRDQGIYAYAGKLLLEGKIDYKHVFDLKPPGVHFVFAIGQIFFGESMLSMRIFDLIWQSLTGFVLFLITYKLTGSKPAGLLAPVLYIFLYYRMDYWHTLQADGFLNLPFAISVFLLINLNKEKYTLSVLLSGFLFGVTILFKYTLLLFFPLLIVVFLLQTDISLSKRINKIIKYTAGFVLTVLLTAALYYFSGAFNQFIDIQFVQTPLYAKIGYETESTGFIAANVIRLFFGSVYSPLILCSVLLAFYLWKKKEFNFKFLVLFAWTVSSLAGLIVQWKFFLYHFLVIIPSLSTGAAVFISEIHKKYREKFPRLVQISVLIIFAGYFSFGFKPYVKNYTDLWSYVKGDKSLEQIYIEKGFTSDSAFMIGKTFNAINFVKNNTHEYDGIYIWGFDPLIYYLSERKCVSRFIYNFPLYWKENNEIFQKEFMAELSGNKPKLILISQRDPLYFISGYKEDSKLMVEKFPAFKMFLEENYVYKTKIDDFYFYELNNK